MKKILLLLCGLMSGVWGASSSGAASSSGEVVEEIKCIYHMKRLPFDETLQRHVVRYVKAPFMEELTSDDVVTLLEKNYPESPKSQLELAHVYYDLFRYCDYHQQVDAIDYLHQCEKWIALAASQEDPEAMYIFGGRMIEKDEKRAVALIKEAAEEAYPPALYFLAKMQQYGLFVSKNEAEAAERYELAANMRHGVAQIAMQRLTASGKCGVSINEEESKRWRQDNLQNSTWFAKWEYDILSILDRFLSLTKADRRHKEAFYAPTLKAYFKGMRRAKGLYEEAEYNGYKNAQIHLEELSNILAKGKSRKHNVAFEIIQRAPSVNYPKYRHHAIIGLCPSNPRHFTTEYIADLMQRAQRTFDEVTFFIPTGWSIHNYKARGRNKSARKSTVDADKVIIERLKEAFGLCGIPNNPVPKSLWTVVLDADLVQDAESKKEVYIEDSPIYQLVYRRCLRKYEENETVKWTDEKKKVTSEIGYKDLCRAVTAEYMKLEGNETAIDEAVQYLLREMPLFEASSLIFLADCSYNVYHEIPEFLKLIPERAKQGFLQVVPPQSSASSSSSSCHD